MLETEIISYWENKIKLNPKKEKEYRKNLADSLAFLNWVNNN